MKLFGHEIGKDKIVVIAWRHILKNTILYIEDNLDNMIIVKRVLEANDYNFLWAGTGLQGLQMAKLDTPDLILLDINLIDISGLEVVSRLRASEVVSLVNLPVIAVTGHVFQGSAEAALQAGCDDFVTKPVNLDGLHKLIRSYLQVTPGNRVPPKPGGGGHRLPRPGVRFSAGY